MGEDWKDSMLDTMLEGNLDYSKLSALAADPFSRAAKYTPGEVPVGLSSGQIKSAAFGSGLGMAGTGAAIGSAFLPGIGTGIGAGVGFIAGAFQGSRQARLQEDQAKRAYAIQENARKQAWQQQQEQAEWELNEGYKKQLQMQGMQMQSTIRARQKKLEKTQEQATKNKGKGKLNLQKQAQTEVAKFEGLLRGSGGSKARGLVKSSREGVESIGRSYERSFNVLTSNIKRIEGQLEEQSVFAALLTLKSKVGSGEYKNFAATEFDKKLMDRAGLKELKKKLVDDKLNQFIESAQEEKWQLV